MGIKVFDFPTPSSPSFISIISEFFTYSFDVYWWWVCKGLTKLLADNAPKAMKEQKFESYFGRKVAIDASMSIYQFLVRTISLRLFIPFLDELIGYLYMNYVNINEYLLGFSMRVCLNFGADCCGKNWDWDADQWGWWSY